MLWKFYLDKGMGLSNNLKYIIALVALYEVETNLSVKFTILIGATWFIGSFFLGWWWTVNELQLHEIEVQNRFNPFVTEMRDKFK